jgi:PIN domain nuclease of toxin-antitoxin system
LTTTPDEFERAYVVDTNVLIWYLTSNPKLSGPARAIFVAAEHGETILILSAITIAELYFSDKKFGHFEDFTSVYEALKTRPEFEIMSFNADDVLDFDRDSGVPEMHDRMIAGLARRLDVPLIASDVQIVKSGVVRTVW